MKHLIVIGILLLTGCASMVPYSGKVGVMDIQIAKQEIVMGKTTTSTGILVPVDSQTASVIAQLQTISFEDLKTMPPQANTHSQALVLAEINLKTEGAALEAWRHNWCAQAGLNIGCLDQF